MREPHRLRSEITQSPHQINPFHPVFLFFPDSATGATSLQPRRRLRPVLSFLPIVSTTRQAADRLSRTALGNTNTAPSQLSLPCTHANFAHLQVLSRSRKSAAGRKPNRGAGNMQSTQAAQFAALGASQGLWLCCAAVKKKSGAANAYRVGARAGCFKAPPAARKARWGPAAHELLSYHASVGCGAAAGAGAAAAGAPPRPPRPRPAQPPPSPRPP
jgi:hypothetical protein